MQIIRPDMHPLIGGFIFIFLFLITVIGIIFFSRGLKRHKKQKDLTSKILIGTGLLSIAFVVYNYIGYNRIYNKNAAKIVGIYQCELTDATLQVFEDHTWKITKGENLPCKSGTWEYIMSEDWKYWNIISNNNECNCQTGSETKFTFDKYQYLQFERVK